MKCATLRIPCGSGTHLAVNETIADLRRVAVTSIVLALVLGGGAVWLISVMHPWAYILAVVLALGAATALWVAIWAPRRLGGIEQLYTDGALVAGGGYRNA